MRLVLLLLVLVMGAVMGMVWADLDWLAAAAVSPR
jgi:hypothetical protein